MLRLQKFLGQFSPSYRVTVGIDFAVKCMNWDDDTRINLQLWDIAGNEKFRNSTQVYYRYA